MPKLSLAIKQQVSRVKAPFPPEISEIFKEIAREKMNAKIHIFGSAVTGLGLSNNRDLDITLELNTNDEEESLKILARQLKFHRMKQIQPILRARVPIVKFFDRYTNVVCDVNINKHLGIANSNLLKTYVTLDERVSDLLLFVKYWAKVNNINGAYHGYLSSYAWNLMVIYFLQRKEVIPDLQKTQPFEKRYGIQIPDHFIDGFNCKYFNQTWRLPKSTCKEDVGKLLTEFLKFYGEEFDFEKRIISFGGSRNLRKNVVLISPAPFVIVDPFETNHNPARSLTFEKLQHIRAHMNKTLKKIKREFGPSE